MKKSFYQKFAGIFWLLFFVACSSITGDSLVQLKVTTSNSTEIGNALTADPIVFTKALVVLTDIKFQELANCDVESTEFNYKGPFVADLLKQTSIPSFDEIKIAPTTYCKFKFKVDKVDDQNLPTGADPLIVGNSVYVTGNSPEGTPFIAKLEENQEYELLGNSSNGFEFAANQTNTLFLIFDLPTLFSNLELDSLDQSSGTILIDKDNNKDAYDQLKANLQTFSSLVDDSNGNEKLDDDDSEVADNDG